MTEAMLEGHAIAGGVCSVLYYGGVLEMIHHLLTPE